MGLGMQATIVALGHSSNFWQRIGNNAASQPRAERAGCCAGSQVNRAVNRDGLVNVRGHVRANEARSYCRGAQVETPAPTILRPFGWKVSFVSPTEMMTAGLSRATLRIDVLTKIQK